MRQENVEHEPVETAQQRVGVVVLPGAEHPVQRLAIGDDDRVRGVGERQQTADDRGAVTIDRRPEIDVLPVAEPLEQSGLAEHLQVPRDPRLRLRQHVDQVADGLFADGAQVQQPEPCRLAGRTIRALQGVQGPGHQFRWI